MKYYPNSGDYLFSLVHESCKEASGLPLSIQVIGRHFQEELVLHVMKELESESNFQGLQTQCSF